MTTISQERAALAQVPGAPAMRRREQWGARFKLTVNGQLVNGYTVSRPVDEPATRVFIHITVTNPGAYSSNDAHARAIENIGISRFSATGISYNRLIMPDGSLYEGQPIGRRGAHTVNDFKRSTCTTSGCPGRGKSLTAPSYNLNVNSRAYVICQNVGDPVSDKQADTIARAIVADWRAGFITWEAAHNLHGHRCVSSKSCPGDKMWARMGKLHDLIHHYRDNGLTDEENDMFTDDDRAMLKELRSVVTSNQDTKVQRQDADGTAGMRYALQEVWKDTHALTDPKIVPTDWVKKLMSAMARVDAGVAALIVRDPVDIDEVATAQAIVALLPQLDTAQLLAAIQALPNATVAAIKEAL